MPNIFVHLQTEQGDVVQGVDDHGVIAPLANGVRGDRSFVCWRFIREYDNTYFSAPQMPDFIDELERLRPDASAELQQALNEIRAAAERCEHENLYMVLVGD